MRGTRRVLGTALAGVTLSGLMATGLAVGAGAAPAPAPQLAKDFTAQACEAPVRLFDGSSTDGWYQAGPGGFDVVDGTLQSRDGMGLLWYDEQQFDDYILMLDWRVTAETDNSGVFVRFPDPGDDPWVAVDEGYEIQINDNPAGDPQKTGSIYNHQEPSSYPSNEVGEWNRYVIKIVGERYQVFLNGTLVNDFTSTDPARGLEGYVGLQNHDPETRTQFRNIWVQPLCGD
ncbi:hypothetical protein FHR81_000290 [Actinoalloteichus hoggarensis]|uniref:3-keto-alpha-glucoside-1,2-lyase/3-keto-2-hydroxy-glucal hydratase domain-containing protein n=1 Tax=Actinoalloteichus hoggarensis TaxID=1470176 RepID=A0A221W2L5_9PSEU|nr:DUF1080 domain-containing protein [Actinoalloteichus hoggarensis]ASO20028.1 hypothetical protein AHOG_11925 [Actinoalloteichus hoggarensis]MBB5919261.1 hypothetical protein [Actinoalloteichus hoggarensis]